MTIEKRGSEKLLNDENGLSTLSTEELAQVGGMGPIPLGPRKWPELEPIRRWGGSFPHGKPPIDIFSIPGDEFQVDVKVDLRKFQNLGRIGL